MPEVVIVDYGLGNIFSIKNAFGQAGLDAGISSSAREILEAQAVVLPGVGAFGDAMEKLRELGLVDVLKEAALGRKKPFMGICLGLQLMMSESSEFGTHEGLDIIPGRVVRFDDPVGEEGRHLKVPQVGWNRIFWPEGGDWSGTPLDSQAEGEYMYFVHSFYVVPEDNASVLSVTRYGDKVFCSSVARDNIFACQFHPERSGGKGIEIYKNFARYVKEGVDR